MTGDIWADLLYCVTESQDGSVFYLGCYSTVLDLAPLRATLAGSLDFIRLVAVGVQR